MNLKKRGAAAEYARWIFVVVAGGIIILLVYNFLGAQTSSVDQSIAGDFAFALGNIISGASSNSEHVFRFPEEIEIEYNCEAESLLVNGVSSPFTGDAVLFFEKNLKGSAITVRSELFQAPFDVTQMIFVGAETEEDRPSEYNTRDELCARGKLREKTQRVAKAHRQRLNYLRNSPITNCQRLYDSVHTDLIQYESFASFDQLQGFDKSNIEFQNDMAIFAGCPAIY